MPAVSNTPDLPVTSCTSVVELESIETGSFRTGDIAVVIGEQVPVTTYQLDRANVSARNGTSVLYTRNSNPAYGGLPAGASPGRWMRTNLAFA